MSQNLSGGALASAQSYVIAITGKKGSGKTTAANYLAQQGVYTIAFAEPLKRFCDMAFTSVTRSPEPIMLDESLKEKQLSYKDGVTFTPRHILQTIGTNIREMTNPSFFVDIAIKRIANLPSTKHHLDHITCYTLIGDIHRIVYGTLDHFIPPAHVMTSHSTMSFYTNSAIYDLPQGQKTVCISDLRTISELEGLRRVFGDTLTIIRITRPSLKSNDTHFTENELDYVEPDITIINDSSLKDFYAKLDGAIGTDCADGTAHLPESDDE